MKYSSVKKVEGNFTLSQLRLKNIAPQTVQYLHFNFEQEYHSRNTKLDCNVYVTAGSLENYGFIKSITDFIDFLNERNYDGLKLTYEIIDSYNHNNVFLPSIKNTMLMFYGKQNNQG